MQNYGKHVSVHAGNSVHFSKLFQGVLRPPEINQIVPFLHACIILLIAVLCLTGRLRKQLVQTGYDEFTMHGKMPDDDDDADLISEISTTLDEDDDNSEVTPNTHTNTPTIATNFTHPTPCTDPQTTHLSRAPPTPPLSRGGGTGKYSHADGDLPNCLHQSHQQASSTPCSSKEAHKAW